MNYLKKYKFFLIVLMIVSIISCNKNTRETELNKDLNAQGQSASNNIESNTMVYPLVYVDNSKSEQVPDFVWEQNGKQIRFSDFIKNKYVLLNFWGTWCPPCRRELPDLVQIAKEMSDKNLIVIGVALERTSTMSDAIDGVSTFWNSNGLNYPIIIGTGELADAYGGIQAVPTTFLIDNHGKIAKVIEGARTKESFYEQLKSIMK